MNTNKYNIHEAYLYTFKKFILAFTYTPGFDIDFIIDDMKSTFNLHVIKLDGPSYLKSDSVFDYNKLNTDVNEYIDKKKEITLTTTTYGTSILIYGLNLPSKLLKFQIDLHLHFALSTNLFLKTIPDSTIEEYNNFKTLLAENKIHKYFNIKSNKSIDINNAVFDKIIDFFEFKVYGKDYNLYSTKARKESELKSEAESSSEIESSSETESSSINSTSDSKLVETSNIKSDIDLELDTDSSINITLDSDT